MVYAFVQGYDLKVYENIIKGEQLVIKHKDKLTKKSIKFSLCKIDEERDCIMCLEKFQPEDDVI